MTGADFRAARDRLGLSGEELAARLGLSGKARIYEIEARAKVARPLALLMQALLDGWRPADWDKAA